MTDIIIPGWAIGAVFVIFLPWLLFLTKGMNDNQRAIDMNNANDRAVTAELQRIYQLVEKLEKKLDTFLGGEIQFMKSVIRKERKHNDENDE